MNEEVMYIDEHGNQVSPPSQNYIPTSQPKQEKADILDKINPDLHVEIIRNKLMGKDLNANGVWVDNPAYLTRKLTAVGAWEIANLMLGASSRNVSISNLKDHEIKRRLQSITRTAILMCVENWREYGISRKSQLSFVNEIVFTNTLVVLKQPEGEGIRRLITGTTTESRVYNQSQDIQAKQGVFSRWLRK